MSQSLSPSLPERSASVVPLRGSRAHAPSSVLVRARLGEGVGADGARAAVAFFAEVCDLAQEAHGAEERWWTPPLALRVEEVAGRALLSLAEAEVALAELEAGGLLRGAERGYRIEADTLCECPALAWFDLRAARARLHDRAERVAPATALLRELVRLADDQGVVRTTFPRLLNDVLYGRTRLTQALAVLESAALVERRDLPNRMMQLRLLEGRPAAPVSRESYAPPASPPAVGGRMKLPTNVPLQVGGERVELAPGIVPELERAADGRYYLWLGPVRLGPYEV